MPVSLETTLSLSPVTVSRILYLTLLLLWIIRILSMNVKKVVEKKSVNLKFDRNIFLGETNSIESDPDVAGPKIPTAIKREEPAKKKKRITLTDDDNETNFLLITNLTRPFTGEI